MAATDTPKHDELRVLISSAESAGELFRFEYIAHLVAEPPKNHAHAAQEERVEVVAGTISCRIGDEEIALGPGETLSFQAGVPHAVWSAAPAGSKAIGEFRPALDAQEVLESIVGPS